MKGQLQPLQEPTDHDTTSEDDEPEEIDTKYVTLYGLHIPKRTADKGKGGGGDVFSLFKSLTSGHVITRDTMTKALEKMKEHLICKEHLVCEAMLLIYYSQM